MSYNIACTNNKTGFTILDTPPEYSCVYKCDYCYVNKLRRLYPAYSRKLKNNSSLLDKNKPEFIKLLHDDLSRIKQKRIRLFGSGDWRPNMQNIIIKTCEAFSEKIFYIISKSLTFPRYKKYLTKLTAIHNLVVNLSYDRRNKKFTPKRKQGVNLLYTLQKDEEVPEFGYDIIFNVDKRKKSIEYYKNTTGNFCPCDIKLIANKKACLSCERCST